MSPPNLPDCGHSWPGSEVDRRLTHAVGQRHLFRDEVRNFGSDATGGRLDGPFDECASQCRIGNADVFRGHVGRTGGRACPLARRERFPPRSPRCCCSNVLAQPTSSSRDWRAQSIQACGSAMWSSPSASCSTIWTPAHCRLSNGSRFLCSGKYSLRLVSRRRQPTRQFTILRATSCTK